MKINKILAKRYHKGGYRMTRNITCYDIDAYKAVAEIALREGTDVSSIIQNLVDFFLHSLDGRLEQQKIDELESEPKMSDKLENWKSHLAKLSHADRRDLQCRIVAIDNLFDEVEA